MSEVDEQEHGTMGNLIIDGLTGGVGPWGAFRPLVAGALALIPFIYLGQHFNREHQRGFEFTLLQIPLGLTLILFPLLYFWSIFDAYQTAILKTAATHQDDEFF